MRILNQIKASKIIDRIFNDHDSLYHFALMGNNMPFTDSNNSRDSIDGHLYIQEYCEKNQTTDKFIQILKYHHIDIEEFEKYRETESSKYLTGYCAFLICYKIAKKIYKETQETDESIRNKDLSGLFNREHKIIKEYIKNTITKPWIIDNEKIKNFLKKLNELEKLFLYWQKKYVDDPIYVPYHWEFEDCVKYLEEDIKTMRTEYSLQDMEYRERKRELFILRTRMKIEKEVELIKKHKKKKK